MLAQALSIIDILAGIAIAGQMFLDWNPVILLGIIVLIKGLWSIANSFTTRFYLDFIGGVDIIVAIVIIFNISIPLFFLVPIIKGVYSLVMIRM